jgi:hypothetical protein
MTFSDIFKQTQAKATRQEAQMKKVGRAGGNQRMEQVNPPAKQQRVATPSLI